MVEMNRKMSIRKQWKWSLPWPYRNWSAKLVDLQYLGLLSNPLISTSWERERILLCEYHSLLPSDCGSHWHQATMLLALTPSNVNANEPSTALYLCHQAHCGSWSPTALKLLPPKCCAPAYPPLPPSLSVILCSYIDAALIFAIHLLLLYQDGIMV